MVHRPQRHRATHEGRVPLIAKLEKPRTAPVCYSLWKLAFPRDWPPRGAMTHSTDHCDLLLSLSPEGDSCPSGDYFSRMSFCSISFPPSLDFELSLQSQSAANAGIKQ